ncbi:hypothetical protein HOE04_00355 [archaeon]|jgi:hypothetical protein|nr:hypothetical protein [archaeon]
MKLLLTLILILLIIQLTIAQNISIDYPEKVEQNKEFKLTLELINFTQNIYDIKIEILNNENNNIAQNFYNSEWKSTYYWMKQIIDTSQDTKKEFKLKIYKEFEGKTNITIKTRTGNSKEFFTGYEIEIQPQKLKVQNETTATPKSNQTSPTSPLQQNQTPLEQQPQNTIQLTTPKTYNPQSEDIKTQNNIIYQSKNELIKQYSVYGFAILCAILCVLLAFNKLN